MSEERGVRGGVVVLIDHSACLGALTVLAIMLLMPVDEE